MSIPSLLVYQATSAKNVPIWSNICERFMIGITGKDLFMHTQKAFDCENFSTNKNFLNYLKNNVLELTDKTVPASITDADEKMARSTCKSIKLLGCDLQRNQPVEWNEFMVACIGSE